ncbi:hypothetical protein SS50377_27015 [Spironucleus salmonicida]|uniref:Uncharacterized protein n=1 Tax=Spironucleus salmonicida TaxID=348837 RepID=V6LS89_9EUKA|nr:hypothetical protein SS50377_27015 [Spironucleus salmonicida]|eukprot:EST47527.1 Hypothetical protein SS50377_12511 [Spironucleus salmonicida]
MLVKDILKQPPCSLGGQVVTHIIGQKFTQQEHLFLVVTTNPQQPFWISALEAATFKDQLSIFYRYKVDLTNERLQPANQFYKNGKFVSQFRFPGGDMYIPNLEKAIMPEKQQQATPGFATTTSLEEAIAKALVFPLPTQKNHAIYAKVRQRLLDYPFPEFLTGDNYAVWSLSADVAEIIAFYLQMKGKGKIAVFGYDYYATAQRLERLGITSSLIYDDDCDVIFISEDDNNRYELLITNKPLQTIMCKRKCLLLRNASFLESYARFLLKIDRLSAQQVEQLFAAVEIGYFNNILSENNTIPRHLSYLKPDISIGSKSIVYKYDVSLAEQTRIKQFLDSDIVAQRVLGDNKLRKEKLSSKSHVSYLSFTAYLTGQILKNLWLQDDFSAEESQIPEVGRKAEIDGFVRSFSNFGVGQVLMVVPDFTLPSVKKHLIQSGLVELKFQLHKEVNFSGSSDRLSVVLLGESALISYTLTTQIHNGFVSKQLPGFVLLPFVSTRQVELIVNIFYQQLGVVQPSVFTILAENSIEEQVLVYRQQVPHQSMQEFYQLKKNYFSAHAAKQDGQKLFNSIINFIKVSGFDGNCAINQPYDYTALGASLQQESSNSTHLTDKFTRMTVNHYNQNELILQASLIQIFNINRKFNLHVFASHIYGSKLPNSHFSTQFYDFSGLSYIEVAVSDKIVNYYQLDSINSFYYLCNTNFDKGMVLYYNNQFPTISQSQQQISDQINKFMIFNNASCGQQIVSQFMAVSREVKVSDINSYDVKRVERGKAVIKSYIYLPLAKLQNDSYQFIQCFQRNNSSYPDTTICSECLDGQKAILNGKTCDICEQPMDSIAEDCASYKWGGKINQNWKLGEFFSSSENQPGAVDFILNKQLITVAYQGGCRYDNIVIRGGHQYLDEETNRQLYDTVFQTENEIQQRERFIAFTSLIDRARILSYGGCFEPHRQNYAPQNAIISYLVADQVVRQGGVLTNLQLSTFADLPITRVLAQACPFELFVPLQAIYYNFDFRKIYFQNSFSFYDSASQFIESFANKAADFAEFCAFSVRFLKINRVSNILERFIPEKQHFFIEELIKTHLKQADYGSDFGVHLISASTFYTRCIACDNLLITNLMSNIMNFGPKNSVFHGIKISQKHFFNTETQQQAQLFVLHRFFSSVLKTISCNNSVAFLPTEHLNKVIQRYRQSKSSEEVMQAVEIGFTQNSLIQGAFGLDIDIKAFTGQVSDFRMPPTTKQRKFIQQQLKSQTPSFVSPIVKQQVQMLKPLSRLNSVVEPLIQTPITRTIQTPPPYLFFDDQIRKISLNQLKLAVRRICDQYNPRYYYAKRNLLFVPTTMVLSPRDMVGYIFGQQPTQQGPDRGDKDFQVLLQIVSNDYSSQMQKKQPTLSKFHMLTDEQKAKVEEASRQQFQDLWFYKNVSVFYQLILKRFIQSHVDLQRNQIVVFQQDPVFGVQYDQQPKSIHAISDRIYDLSEGQIKDLFGQLYNQAQQIDSLERKTCVELLLRYGLSSGSSPFETFHRCIQKTDLMSRTKNINIILQLLILSAQYGLEFPFKYEKLTTNKDELRLQIRRLQRSRLMQIKLQQYEFLQWLNRVLQNKGDVLTAENKREIEGVISSHIHFDFHVLYKDGDLNSSDIKQLDRIVDQAKKIEELNVKFWIVDNKFSLYFSDRTNQDFKLMLIDTERFYINDCAKTDLRKQYEILKLLKLSFLGCFGSSEDRILHLLNQQKIAKEDFEYITALYKRILFIWSRSHDYILMHATSETGYGPHSIGLIMQAERSKPRKHFDFLRDSCVATEFEPAAHDMFKVYKAARRDVPDVSSQKLILDDVKEPTDQQIFRALQVIRKTKLAPEELFQTTDITPETMKHRFQVLEGAVRCERMLFSDPLNKFSFDEGEPRQEPQVPVPVKVLAQRPPPVSPPGNQRQAIAPNQQMPRSQQRMVDSMKLSFYNDDDDIVKQFILERIEKCQMTKQLQAAADLDSFLFILSSCQRVNSQDWGKLYSFMIKEKPQALDRTTTRIRESYRLLRDFALTELQVDRDQTSVIFSRLDKFIYHQTGNEAKRPEMDMLVRDFVAGQLDLAYFHAFNMRDMIIRGETEVQKMKEDIHSALKAMQVMSHNPLNKLVQGDDVLYKRKMALATYLFLCNQYE